MKNFLKKYLIAGVLVLVPAVATIWVLKTLIVWLDGLIFSFIPHQLKPEYLENIPGLGLILTFVVVMLVGALTRFYIGRKLVQLGDSIFARVPFGRAIYQAIKSVLQTTFSDGGQKIRRVVLVEYPKTGSYAMGFLTGKWSGSNPDDKINGNSMVFIPTAPNPTSGFLLIVSDESLIPTNLSTEEASKILISGGLLAKKAEVL